MTPPWTRRTAAAFTLTLAATAWALPVRAGYVTLSQSGTNVLKTCNPSNSASNSACRVTSLPGESGYQLVASRSAPIIINGVTVGTQYEKVWRHCTDTTAYIFGTRVQMNAEVWDGTGLAFNVNDLLRQVRSDQSVAVAYYAGSPAATKLLSYAGRTSAGLNEYDTAQPPRENGWVDFRVDANAADPDGQSSPYSPWLLVKTRAPEGYALQSFALRLLNSDVEEGGDANSIYAAGYQPVCTSTECAPGEED